MLATELSARNRWHAYDTLHELQRDSAVLEANFGYLLQVRPNMLCTFVCNLVRLTFGTFVDSKLHSTVRVMS